MNIERNRTKVATIALVLMLTFAAIFVALPIVSAHDPPWTDVPTWSYIIASPNPVGVGQTAAVVFWLNWVPPGAGGSGGDRWRNLTIDIEKPDGSKETLGPFISDPVGGGYTLYTPDQIGIYTFTFSFPGQTVSLYGPTGIIASNDARNFMPQGAYINDTFLASSATTTLTVQQEPIPAAPSYPLPTEYWTRPIEGQNAAWSRIASNWLIGGGPRITYNVQPDGIAPNSPHIMWTKPLQDGGIVGGSYPIDDITYYTGINYESRFNYPMVINGRLYYDLPLGSGDVEGSGGAIYAGGYVCVDLRTGETLWWQNWTAKNEIPHFGQLYDYESGNQHGVLQGILWMDKGTTWEAYDSLTGNWLFTLTGVPGSISIMGGNQFYGPSGEILRYIIKYDQTANSGWLALWNNTAAADLCWATTGTNAWQWRPNRKIIDASQAYSWNVTLPALPNIGGQPEVRAVIMDDLLLGTFGSSCVEMMVSYVEPRTEPWTVFAISLKPETRGQLLWIKNYTTTNNVTRYFGLVDTVNRVWTLADMQTQKWSGYSIDNGNLLWGPVGNETAYNYYVYGGINFYNTGAQSICDGILYLAGMGGIIYARDIKTGELLWTYKSNPGYAADPWPLWPIYIGNIADGKIYTFTFEHSASAPLRKGAKIHCLNATTGEKLWTLSGWPESITHSMRAGVIADGYLAYFNAYDGQVYCVGKGPSKTTVTVQDDVIAKGDSVIIKGMVTDESAGTKQTGSMVRFPNGVPAIADEYMSEWMEYLYMQKPMPAYVEGVEVKLEVLDSNNNFDEIGRVTSDASGMFKLLWEPPVEGEYTIIATFEGSDSYWSSYAETAIGVTEAPSPAQPIQPEEPTGAFALGATEVAIIAAVSVAVVIGIVAYWTLRKRK